MAKPNREYESLKRAVEIAGIDWDNVIVFVSKYDTTKGITIPALWDQGNSYAIEAQVREWVKDVEDGGMGCGMSCRCDAASEDDDDDDDDDHDSDDIGNR
jgi:hypothetical protein